MTTVSQRVLSPSFSKRRFGHCFTKPTAQLTAQQGFSLVELMISLTLGLFISLMVIQTYLTSVRADKTVFAQSEIQENARFSLQVVEKSLQQAGYFADLAQDRSTFFLAQQAQWPQTVFSGTEVLHGFDDSSQPVSNQPSSDSGTDQVFLRFVTGKNSAGENAAWYSCNGVLLDPDTVVEMAFYVKGEALICRSQAQGAAADTQPLVDHVENFQLIYGIDSSGNGAVSRYLSAQDVDALGAWSRVRTVQLRLELTDAQAALQSKVFEKTLYLRNI